MNKYKYSVRNGGIVLTNTKSNKSKTLTNFTATISKEEHVIKNGKKNVYLHIQGKLNDGNALESLRLNAVEFDDGKWFHTYWGTNAELNKIGVPNALEHLLLAIRRLSSKIVKPEYVFDRTGFINQLNEPKFSFANGTVTAKGIDKNTRTQLPSQSDCYRLPDEAVDQASIQSATKEVFKLLDISPKNPYIGILLCITPFRAVISTWIPVDLWFFLESRQSNNCVAGFVQAYFGSLDDNNARITWKSTAPQLENWVNTVSNSVLCINDLVYPPESNRASDLTKKVDRVLGRLFDDCPKTSFAKQYVGIESNNSIQKCLVISTGESSPRNAKESVHEYAIHVPIQQNDIPSEKLVALQSLAEQGVLATANIAFIQYLLGNYQKIAQYSQQYYQNYFAELEEEFPGNTLVKGQIAGLLVAWRFFRRFALNNKVLPKDELEAYGKTVKDGLIELMRKQQSIQSFGPGKIFIKGLKQAFITGKAHVIDATTGKRPIGIAPSKLGWQDKKPNGLWIGWHCSQNGDIYLRGDLSIKHLINLLPEPDRMLFSTTTKKFWIDLKSQNLLKCSEKDRNTTRKKLAGANMNSNYHLSLTIRPKPKASTSENSKTGPDKSSSQPKKSVSQPAKKVVKFKRK